MKYLLVLLLLLPVIGMATPTPTVTVTVTPSMALTKTVDKPIATIGETLTFCFFWINDSAESKNMVIIDRLSDGLIYINSTPTASVNGQMIMWDLGSVTPYSNGFICFEAKVGEYP